ncbi:MAG: CopG family transcriptional regulator [Actinomycetota bacterium]
MKRLQIYIQEEMDDALALEATRLGTSKAALIRDFIRDKLPLSSGGRDPLDEIVGWAKDVEASYDIDEVVYGR